MGRSRKRGPFVVSRLWEKVLSLDKQPEGMRVVEKVWARSMTIAPRMIGFKFGVYNGMRFIPVVISDQMVGHKLGEFSPTRQFRSHLKKDKRRKK